MSRLPTRHGSANTGREVAASRDERTIDLVEWLNAQIEALEAYKDEPCPQDCPICEEDRGFSADELAFGEGKRSSEAVHGEDPQASQEVKTYFCLTHARSVKHFGGYWLDCGCPATTDNVRLQAW